jgi:hypothetical protein
MAWERVVKVAVEWRESRTVTLCSQKNEIQVRIVIFCRGGLEVLFHSTISPSRIRQIALGALNGFGMRPVQPRHERLCALRSPVFPNCRLLFPVAPGAMFRICTWNVEYASPSKNPEGLDRLRAADADLWVLTESQDRPDPGSSYQAVHSESRPKKPLQRGGCRSGPGTLSSNGLPSRTRSERSLHCIQPRSALSSSTAPSCLGGLIADRPGPHRIGPNRCARDHRLSANHCSRRRVQPSSAARLAGESAAPPGLRRPRPGGDAP